MDNQTQPEGQIVFHLTPAEKLPDIMREGLLPQTGPRSTLANEPFPAVHCFRSVDEAEDGYINWLADEFEDGTVMALLSINTAGLDTNPENQAFCEIFDQVIPTRITIVAPDFDLRHEAHALPMMAA